MHMLIIISLLFCCCTRSCYLLARDTMREYHLQRVTLFACESNLKTLPAVVFLELRTPFALQAHELLDTLWLRPRCIYSQSTTLSRGTIFHSNRVRGASIFDKAYRIKSLFLPPDNMAIFINTTELSLTFPSYADPIFLALIILLSLPGILLNPIVIKSKIVRISLR
eukprot:sb/3472396/